MEGRGLISASFPNASPLIVDLRTQDAAGRDLPGKTFFGGITNPIGIEVEVEGVASHEAIAFCQKNNTFWSYTEDGSLKDKGVEFVSKPLAGRGIDKALALLGAWFGANQHKFTHRCSIHIHQHAGDLTEQDLNRLFSYYIILEGALFVYCAAIRECSAFCVPLTATNPRPHASLEGLSEHNKYLALNLFPLVRQHTIEYRHLEGTSDMRKVRRWIQMLCKLHRYVTITNKDIFTSDLDKFSRGDTTPLAKMLGIHFNLLFPQDVSKSMKLGYEWLAVRGVF